MVKCDPIHLSSGPCSHFPLEHDGFTVRCFVRPGSLLFSRTSDRYATFVGLAQDEGAIVWRGDMKIEYSGAYFHWYYLMEAW